MRAEAGAQALEALGATHGRLAARGFGAALRAVPLLERVAALAFVTVALPFADVAFATLALTFFVVVLALAAVTLPFAVLSLAGAVRAKRGGSPSCFRQRTRPRPMSTCKPPHCGHGSSSG